MRSALMLCALLALAPGALAGSGGTKKKSKAERWVGKAVDGVARLGDANYTRYMGDLSSAAPIQADAIVLYTAAGEEFGCQPCGAVESMFASVARSYQATYGDVPPEKRLLWAVVDVEHARQVFHGLGLQTVPHIGYHPKKESLSNTEYLPLPSSEAHLAALVEGKIPGAKIPVYVDPSFKHNVSTVTALCVALLGHLLVNGSLLAVLRSRYLWQSVSILAFATSIAGSAFSVIRSAPLYGGYGRSVQFFSSGGRDQFVLEGFAVAGVTLVVAVGFSLAWWLIGRGKGGAAGGVVRQAGATLGLAVAVFALVNLYDAYATKTAWYSWQNTLPAGVRKVLTGKVRRASPLFRRVLRAANVWLNEYTSWAGFAERLVKILFP